MPPLFLSAPFICQKAGQLMRFNQGGGRRKEGGPREEEEGKRKEGGTRIGMWR
jgi:hypothetical protein